MTDTSHPSGKSPTKRIIWLTQVKLEVRVLRRHLFASQPQLFVACYDYTVQPKGGIYVLVGS